jgi:hypothetical protein
VALGGGTVELHAGCGLMRVMAALMDNCSLIYREERLENLDGDLQNLMSYTSR